MKLKIVNKKRFFRANFIIILFIITSFIIVNISNSKTKIEYRIDYILKGETLWKIAERESKKNGYYKNKDIREIIYDLQEINNLKKGNLLEGTRIKIPIYDN